MKLNIAECRQRLEILRKEREELYKQKLQAIDNETEKLTARIKTICKHHEDMLLVEVISYDDEYGHTLESSEKWNIKCTICDRERYIYSSYIRKNNPDLSDLLNLTYEECEKLR